MAWSLLAVAAIWAGGIFGRLTLQVHGGIFLLLAPGSSSALEQAAGLLLGSRAWPGGAPWAIWSGAADGRALLRDRTRQRGDDPSWSSRALRIWWRVRGLAGGGHGGRTAHLRVPWIFGADATHAYCATLRTCVLSGTALLLAWGAGRWDRPEFGRLVYPVMALGGYRMIGVDLRQDRTAALFLSLLLYGGALILLPKIIRAGCGVAGSAFPGIPQK